MQGAEHRDARQGAIATVCDGKVRCDANCNNAVRNDEARTAKGAWVKRT